MSCDAWPVVWPCDERPTTDEVKTAAALAAAQSVLWARTGRRLGLCTVTETYRMPLVGGGCGVPYMTDDLVWHNGGRRGGVCCAIELVSQPVRAIEAVWIDGQLVDASGYRLEGTRLVRGGSQCWPMGVYGDCDEGRIKVRYRFGVPLTAPVEADPTATPPVAAVPPAPYWGLAATAMGELAIEFLNAMCGKPCRLPSRAVSVTRQGVTTQLADPTTLKEKGLLGLEMCDALIETVNPTRARQRSRVFSPDFAQRA